VVDRVDNMKKGHGQETRPRHRLVEVVLFGKKTQVLEVIN